MRSFAYSIGRVVGSNRALAVTVLALTLGTAAYIEREHKKAEQAATAKADADNAAKVAKQRADATAAEAKRQKELDDACSSSGQKALLAVRAMNAGDAQRAFDAVKECNGHLNDPQVKALYLKAMATAREQDVAETKRLAAAQRAEKKKHGVHIGMSQQDVLDSSWGKPLQINRTTTAFGTNEQWVYGLRNYLYFENGILTAIQN